MLHLNHAASSHSLLLLLLFFCFCRSSSISRSSSSVSSDDDSYLELSHCSALLQQEANTSTTNKFDSDFDFENAKLIDLKDPSLYFKHCPYSPSTFSPCTTGPHAQLSVRIYTGLNVSETPEQTRTNFIDIDANTSINENVRSTPFLYGDFAFQGHLFAIPDAYIGR